MMRYYYNQRYHTLETHMAAASVLEKAVAADPEFGTIAAMLASLYQIRYFLDFPDCDAMVEKAAALDQVQKYDMPQLFSVPMLRAAVFGELGRKQEAQEQLQHLKILKPDFTSKSQVLIRRFVKEEDLAEHIIEGLKKAGLQIH